MRNVSPHIDIERLVLVTPDEVDGGVERVVVTPLRAVLQGLPRTFTLINAIVRRGRILFRCSRPAGSGADVPLAEMPGGISVVAEQLA